MDTLAKLRWQCRRGTKELDALLQGYLTTQYMKADNEEKSRFALLLKWEDDELLDVLVGWKEPDAAGFDDLVDKIRSIPLSSPDGAMRNPGQK